MEKFKIKNKKNIELVVQVDNEKGKDLVFIAHGLGGFKEQDQIETFARAFIDSGYTVVRWDAAHSIGESGGNIIKATLTNYFGDFEDVVKWAKVQPWYQEPFVISGHSLGSACCILYSTKYPKKVKALAPISAFLSGKTFFDSLSRKVTSDWKSKGYRLEESSSKPGVIKRLAWRLMENLLKYELFDRAKRIKVPTLLMVGSEDTGTPLRDQKRFYKDLGTKDKELHVIKGSPHTFTEKNHLDEIYKIMKKWASRMIAKS